MNNPAKKKREPWRIVVGLVGVAFIVFLWIKKDVWSTYASLPREQAIPLIVTTLAVTLVKVAVMTGGILLVKWLIGKLANRGKAQ